MAVGARPLVPSRIGVGRRSGSAHGSQRAPRSVVGAYIALTKPRIIELLLITTVPTMVLAERPVPPETAAPPPTPHIVSVNERALRSAREEALARRSGAGLLMKPHARAVDRPEAHGQQPRWIQEIPHTTPIRTMLKGLFPPAPLMDTSSVVGPAAEGTTRRCEVLLTAIFNTLLPEVAWLYVQKTPVTVTDDANLARFARVSHCIVSQGEITWFVHGDATNNTLVVANNPFFPATLLVRTSESTAVHLKDAFLSHLADCLKDPARLLAVVRVFLHEWARRDSRAGRDALERFAPAATYGTAPPDTGGRSINVPWEENETPL